MLQACGEDQPVSPTQRVLSELPTSILCCNCHSNMHSHYTDSLRHTSLDSLTLWEEVVCSLTDFVLRLDSAYNIGCQESPSFSASMQWCRASCNPFWNTNLSQDYHCIDRWSLDLKHCWGQSTGTHWLWIPIVYLGVKQARMLAEDNPEYETFQGVPCLCIGQAEGCLPPWLWSEMTGWRYDEAHPRCQISWWLLERKSAPWHQEYRQKVNQKGCSHRIQMSGVRHQSRPKQTQIKELKDPPQTSCMLHTCCTLFTLRHAKFLSNNDETVYIVYMLFKGSSPSKSAALSESFRKKYPPCHILWMQSCEILALNCSNSSSLPIAIPRFAQHWLFHLQCSNVKSIHK